MPKFTLEVSRTMAHLHRDGNFTGISVPVKTAEQRELAAYVLAALTAFTPPAKEG